MHVLFAFLATAIAFSPKVFAFPNTVYIISNAETPSLGLPGLTPVGIQRVEQCIPSVFASLDVGKIISCPPDPDSGACFSTIATATPLANALNLAVDTSCGADEETDDDCVTKLMKKFSKTSNQSIAIVWDLDQMDSLFENIDADEPDNDDDDDDDDDDDEDDSEGHYDILTTVVKGIIKSEVSQNCTGIDGQAPGSFRRSLHARRLKRRETSMKRRHIVSRINRIQA
ncbi:hypothetical protein BDQ12DRAFT_694331 [Crucibulum laeve]|uniref:Uncharacterized protein n=1 Tax=Crucibulum laeve TaxID=68775 RepID=A0A5C3LF33_9AGAR|nr:hypothetical protein BDQ12DRAFT_694331 [Crucibulum laeve]